MTQVKCVEVASLIFQMKNGRSLQGDATNKKLPKPSPKSSEQQLKPPTPPASCVGAHMQTKFLKCIMWPTIHTQTHITHTQTHITLESYGVFIEQIKIRNISIMRTSKSLSI